MGGDRRRCLRRGEIRQGVVMDINADTLLLAFIAVTSAGVWVRLGAMGARLDHVEQKTDKIETKLEAIEPEGVKA